MAYENKPGWGAVFRNEDKEEGDKKPGLKGKVRLPSELGAGTAYISLWKKRSKAGDVYYSLHLEMPKQQQQKAPQQQKAAFPDEWEDDISM